MRLHIHHLILYFYSSQWTGVVDVHDADMAMHLLSTSTFHSSLLLFKLNWCRYVSFTLFLPKRHTNVHEVLIGEVPLCKPYSTGTSPFMSSLTQPVCFLNLNQYLCWLVTVSEFQIKLQVLQREAE
jgi:hypothetical protein